MFLRILAVSVKTFGFNDFTYCNYMQALENLNDSISLDDAM
jgi:hypothetical protein